MVRKFCQRKPGSLSPSDESSSYRLIQAKSAVLQKWQQKGRTEHFLSNGDHLDTEEGGIPIVDCLPVRINSYIFNRLGFHCAPDHAKRCHRPFKGFPFHRAGSFSKETFQIFLPDRIKTAAGAPRCMLLLGTQVHNGWTRAQNN